MSASTWSIDKKQFLHDIVRTLRKQLAAAPDVAGNSYFCLKCWQPMPADLCTRCYTTDYSAPILTIEQLTSIRWILDQLEPGVDGTYLEDDIPAHSA